MPQRNYAKEYREYHAKPAQKKRRAQRNAARRKMAAAGKVRKDDGKDVHHRDHNTANNSRRNLAILPRSKNRAMNRKTR